MLCERRKVSSRSQKPSQRPEPRQDPTRTILREVETRLTSFPGAWPHPPRKTRELYDLEASDHHVATQRTSSKHFASVMDDYGSAITASKGRPINVCDDSGQLLTVDVSSTPCSRGSMDSFATRFHGMSAREQALGAGEGSRREGCGKGVRGARVGGRRGGIAEIWTCGKRRREEDEGGRCWRRGKVEREIRSIERNKFTIVIKVQW